MQPAAGKTHVLPTAGAWDSDTILTRTMVIKSKSRCSRSRFRCDARLGAMQSFIVLREPAQNLQHLCGPEGQTFTGTVALTLVEQTQALCHFPIPATLGHSTFSFHLGCLFYTTSTKVGRSIHIMSCAQTNQVAQGFTLVCNLHILSISLVYTYNKSSRSSKKRHKIKSKSKKKDRFKQSVK